MDRLIMSRRGLALVAVVVAISLYSAVSPAVATDIQWIEPEYTTGLIEAGAGVVATGKPNEKNLKPGRAKQVKTFQKPAPGSGKKKQNNKQQKQTGGGGGKKQKQTGGGGGGKKPADPKPAKPAKSAKPAGGGAKRKAPKAPKSQYPPVPSAAQRTKTATGAARREAAQKGMSDFMGRLHNDRTNRNSDYYKTRQAHLSRKQKVGLHQPGTEKHQRATEKAATAKAAHQAQKTALHNREWAEYKLNMPGAMSNAGGPMTPREAKQRMKRMQAGDPTALNGLTKNRESNHPKVQADPTQKRKVINTPYAGRDAPGQDAAHQKAFNRATKREYGLVLSPDGQEAVIVKGGAGKVPGAARSVCEFRLCVVSSGVGWWVWSGELIACCVLYWCCVVCCCGVVWNG